MTNIDWQEFKEFRSQRGKNDDIFETMLKFLKSYYNMFNTTEIYETLKNDDTAKLMLNKRDIVEIEDFERYLLKNNL